MKTRTDELIVDITEYLKHLDEVEEVITKVNYNLYMPLPVYTPSTN